MALGRNHYNSPNREPNSNRSFIIFVRKTGNDRNDGRRLERSVKTLARAMEIVPESSKVAVIVDIGPGLWSEDITIPSIRFFGNRVLSRSLSSKIGLGGFDTDRLGFLIRGSVGGLSDKSFKYLAAEKFSPKPVLGEDIDGNSYDYYYPSTVIEGSVFIYQGSFVEFSVLSICSRKPFSICSYGGIASFRGVSLESAIASVSAEGPSDIRIRGSIVRNPNTAIRAMSKAYIGVEFSYIYSDKIVLASKDGSFIKVSDSLTVGSVDCDNTSLVVQ